MNFTSMLAAGHERKFVQADLKAVMAAHGHYRHCDWNDDTPPADATAVRMDSTAAQATSGMTACETFPRETPEMPQLTNRQNFQSSTQMRSHSSLEHHRTLILT